MAKLKITLKKTAWIFILFFNFTYFKIIALTVDLSRLTSVFIL